MIEFKTTCSEEKSFYGSSFSTNSSEWYVIAHLLRLADIVRDFSDDSRYGIVEDSFFSFTIESDGGTWRIVGVDIARGGYHGMRIHLKDVSDMMTEPQVRRKIAVEHAGYYYAVCYSATQAWAEIRHYVDGHIRRS